MNYGELKTAIEEDSHRPDLATLIPRFITEGEGMIRRELVAMSVTDTLEESDRVADGVYTLPTGLQTIRNIYKTGTPEWSLTKVSLSELRGLAASVDPSWYAEIGTNNVEIRGVPGTGVVFDIEYTGHPAALVDDSDTNDLLTNHESLYIEAAMFYLHKHTQNIELASIAQETYSDVLGKLNEQYGRKFGGASQANGYNLYGGAPAY